jgi:subtilisin family serine protease
VADAVPNERIVARIDPAGTYYYVLRGPRTAAGTRVEVSSPTHPFQFRERAGSVVAPATAEAAVSVGAYDPRDGRVEPFSSAGPTTDGRPGIDIVAPDRLRAAGDPDGLVGSSAAAPYTAGVVALLLDAGGDLPPETVARFLETTARDVGPDGVDPVAGHGLLAPERAVDAARNASRGGDQSSI